MTTILTDLSRSFRIAVRDIGRAPGAAIVVCLTVALGVAAASTLFSVIDALFLRPLPGVGHPSGLVNVHATEPDGSTFHSVSYPDWRELDRAKELPFSGVAAFSSRLVSLAVPSAEPRLAVLQIVTPNYFRILESRPYLGRFLNEEEPGAPVDEAVVLSHAAWKDRFGSDPNILGRTVLVNGRPFSVIGVAPPGFTGNFLAEPFDLWISIRASAGVRGAGDIESPDRKWLELVGRRKPGLSIEAAGRAMSVLARRLEHMYPTADRGLGFDLRRATGFEDSLRSTAVAFFSLLGLLGLAVLGIACANVTGILLARALAREREIGIRAALGQSRPSLVRHLLLETLVLFALGGAVGVAVSAWTVRLLERFEIPAPIPIAFDFAPGVRTVLFAAAASIAGALVFGLFPAFAATRPQILELLRSGSSTERARTSRMRSAFVAAQVALSVLLLVAAGLFQRSVRLSAVADPGFRADGATTTRIDFSLLGYDAPRARAAFERLLAGVRSIPGVESATIATPLPLGPARRTAKAGIPGSPEESLRTVESGDVGNAYFDTMGIPLLRGRAFSAFDRPDGAPVAIVNETLGRTFWKDGDPLGRSLEADGRVVTVVGVARDGKYRSLGEAPRPFLYLPASQSTRTSFDLVVRGGGGAEVLAPAIRREIRAIDPAVPAGAIVSLRQYISFSTVLQRSAGAISGALGLLGLLLTAIGLAGLVAHSVSRRTREIGLRLAVGARPRDILQLEIRRATLVSGVGFALGSAAAFFATPLLSRFLFGIRGTDPATWAAAGAVLLGATLLASWLPARRGARMDPLKALKSE
ncbi:MAG TPA: ABC transporter permease [Thermoanaerobaculia bacterium]